MHPEAVHNPTLLKLGLLLRGVAPADGAPRADFVELLLDGDTYARVRTDPESPFRLIGHGEARTLKGAGADVAVRIMSGPEVVQGTGPNSGRPGPIAEIHGSYATVRLGGGCGLGAPPGRACALCLGRELTEKAGELWPVADVVEAARAAFDEGVAEFVHLRLGYFPGDDAGVHLLKPYVDAIHRHFDTTVAVSMHPPASPRAIDATYALGVDVLSYDLEAPDEAALRRYLPGRARFFGRTRYLEALRHAARVFPSGAVWSALLVDLAPAEALAAAVDELAGMGVVPLLGVSAEGPRRAVEPEELKPVIARLFDSTVRAGLSATWARDLSFAITPLEARHCVADAPQLPLLLQQLTRNRLGALAARSLARLRRRLRVKRVRASFESSRL